MKNESTFHICVEYENTKGKHTKDYEITAKSARAARERARTRFNSDWRRRSSHITKVSHIGGTVPIQTPAPAPTIACAAPQPEFFVGQRLEVLQGPQRGVAYIRALFRTSDNRDRATIEFASGRGIHSPTLNNLRERLKPEETVEYHVLYPNGNWYNNNAPVSHSGYPLDQLVQIKVCKVDGKVVRKELI